MDYAGAAKKKMEITLGRKEIESKLAVSGDYVKMDFLQSCLKKQLDFDTKRFVMLKLSSIYESRMMYLEAAKLMRNVADINTTFDGKYIDFSKSMDLFIKAGNFDDADLSFKKALACGNEKQKLALRIKLKDVYKTRAKDLLAKDKRNYALQTYERLLSLPLDVLEKKEIQQSLLKLYQNLGKIKEYYALQKSIANPPVQKQQEIIEKKDDFDMDELFR